MTYDIVFKKFFTDKPHLLRKLLEHFLEIKNIKDCFVTNPEIPELKDDTKPSKKKHRESKEKHNKQDSKNTQNLLKHHNQLKKLSNTQKDTEAKHPVKKTNLENKETLTFLDTNLLSENRQGKRVFLDIRVKLSTGEDINVEVQSYQEPHFLNRILFYWAKLHSQSLKKGEGYDKLTPTYSLIFTEKACLDDSIKDFMSSFSLRRTNKPYVLLSEDLKIVIVELSKLKKSSGDLFDFKELWCYFIGRSGDLTSRDKDNLSKHEEMEEAMEYFYELTQEEKLRQKALDDWRNDMFNHLNKVGWREEGMKEGIEEGIKRGIEKGMEKGREELILSMLEKGSEVDFVVEVTGLPKAKVLKIKKKLKN